VTAPYRKGSLAEYEACHLLKQQGWIVSRWFGNPSPPDLFAARKAEILLVMVRYSRGLVPDAHAVSVVYGSELDRLRSVGDPGFVQKECWVLTPQDGWKYYEVFPGGIRRIWREWEVPGKSGRVGEVHPVPAAGALSPQM
jgi:Holliday junction resolvase-like predicted endonuclease